MDRILLVFGSLERAGAQLRTLAVCRHLQDRYAVQFDICWLGLGPNDLQEDLNSVAGDVYYLPIKSPRFTLDFISLLRRNRYRAVNVFARSVSPYLLWLARLNGVEIRIASMRNAIGQNERGLSNPIGLGLFRWTLNRFATDIVAVSHTTMDDVFPERWRTGARFQVIYNGFEPQRLINEDKERSLIRREVRAEFGWPDESRIVVHVGRMAYQKNHETIIAAVRQSFESDSRLRLLLVGSGPRLAQVQRWLREEKIDRITSLAGVRTDVPRLLKAADVFFFPSRWEGLPGALIEALGTGLSVVASDIPQIAEVGIDHYGRSSVQFAESPFNMDYCVEAYAHVYGCVEATCASYGQRPIKER